MNTQQDTLYAAERVLPKGRTFADLASTQRYVDELTDSWWWTAFYPNIERVMLIDSNLDTSFASPNISDGIGEIGAHPAQLHARMLSHELAHIFARSLHGSNSHDPWFARERLVTAYCMLGPDAYSDLYDSFFRHGIQVADGMHTHLDRRIAL